MLQGRSPRPAEAAPRAVLPGALRALTGAHPKLEPPFREVDPAEVGAELRGVTLDVALFHVYDLTPGIPQTGLELAPAFVENLHLAAHRILGPRPSRAWKHPPAEVHSPEWPDAGPQWSWTLHLDPGTTSKALFIRW